MSKCLIGDRVRGVNASFDCTNRMLPLGMPNALQVWEMADRIPKDPANEQ